MTFVHVIRVMCFEQIGYLLVISQKIFEEVVKNNEQGKN